VEYTVTTERRRLNAVVEGRDERGQILILVMGMLVMIGIFAGALVGLATPTFHHAASVRNLNDTVATADSGINWAIQSLQGNPTPCLETTPTPMSGPPSVNTGNAGSLSVSCQAVQLSTPPYTPPAGVNYAGVSYAVIKSTFTPSSGTPVVTAEAVVQVNDTSGSATVVSWRICQDKIEAPSC
jgi:hypothetical protein